MQTRVTRKIIIEPSDEITPPGSFDLIIVVTQEARRSDREIWRQDSDAPGTNPLRTRVASLTRAGLAGLIAKGADWLAYVSDDEVQAIA